MLVEKITSGNGQYQMSFSIKNQHLSQSTKVHFISVVFSLPGGQKTCKIDYVTCVMLYLDISYYYSSSSCSCTDLKKLSEAIGLRRSSTYALSKTWNLWLRRKHAEHVFSLTVATTSHHWSLLIQTTRDSEATKCLKLFRFETWKLSSAGTKSNFRVTGEELNRKTQKVWREK